jgi:hypothetical protein
MRKTKLFGTQACGKKGENGGIREKCRGKVLSVH